MSDLSMNYKISDCNGAYWFQFDHFKVIIFLKSRLGYLMNNHPFFIARGVCNEPLCRENLILIFLFIPGLDFI